MTHEQKRRFASLARMAATMMAVAALTIPASMSAQTPALLAITSPENGAVISPGQTMTVTVTSPANALFDVIGLIGTDGIGIVNAMATAAPAQFSVAIPADMACRTHTLTARGRTTSGQDASADDCVSSSPLAVGAACIVTVTFAPTSTGIRTGSVSVTNGVNDVAVVFKVAGIGQ